MGDEPKVFDISLITGDLESQALGSLKALGITALKEAASDIAQFVTSALPSLGRYVKLYLQDDISRDELQSLVMGLKDLALLNALTVAGLDAIQIDATKNAMLRAITSVLVGAVTKAI